MDIYKIAFVEAFLIAAIGFLIFGSKLRLLEYKFSRFLRFAKHTQNEASGKKAHTVKH